jgi:hypothetical protein
MNDRPRTLKICAIMLGILGAYYAIAFIFVAINLLSKELSFAMEHGSIGVYLHILFISFVHILVASLFIYSAVGISKLNKTSRKLAIIITGLNLFTVLTKTSGWPMFSMKIILFLISLSVLFLLLNKEVKGNF